LVSSVPAFWHPTRGASLTLIELDERFSTLLHQNVPGAVIHHDDALGLLPRMPCDVLISNLPRGVTVKLLTLLPSLAVWTAVVATGENPDLSAVHERFRSEVVTEIAGDDFRPPQPATSLLVKLSRRTGDDGSA
jgi:16S rRNA A1518/A1519 N6-dimethyltransferase RsmA/KsgA/DIM1 with predicted DNA glycosylase/AP lyase activity